MLQPGERAGETGDGTQGTRLGTGADQSHERVDNTGDVSIEILFRKIRNLPERF